MSVCIGVCVFIISLPCLFPVEIELCTRFLKSSMTICLLDIILKTIEALFGTLMFCLITRRRTYTNLLIHKEHKIINAW